MSTKYLIETFGCQMNFHDSERMAGLLEQAGYESTDDDRDADVIVINTCSVREKAEEKLFTRLGEIHHAALEHGERPIVAVAGCVAQQEGDAILQRSKAVDIIIGTQNLKRLPMLVDGAVERRDSGGRRFPALDLDPLADISFPLGIAKRHDPLKAYVTIIEGCNEFCAFCVVPYTRGQERSVLEGSWIAYKELLEEDTYPTLEGLKDTLAVQANWDPKAANAKVEDFVDLRFVNQLKKSGYIDQLYGRSQMSRH